MQCLIEYGSIRSQCCSGLLHRGLKRIELSFLNGFTDPWQCFDAIAGKGAWGINNVPIPRSAYQAGVGEERLFEVAQAGIDGPQWLGR